MHWTAKGDVVTLGAVVDEKLLDGQPTDPAKPAKRRAEIERSRRLETRWLALIAGKTFTPDELRIEARTLVVTLAGTPGDVAHHRVYASFAITSFTLGGGDLRVSAVVATIGLAHFDATGSAHLTRRDR